MNTKVLFVVTVVDIPKYQVKQNEYREVYSRISRDNQRYTGICKVAIHS